MIFIVVRPVPRKFIFIVFLARQEHPCPGNLCLNSFPCLPLRESQGKMIISPARRGSYTHVPGGDKCTKVTGAPVIFLTEWQGGHLTCPLIRFINYDYTNLGDPQSRGGRGIVFPKV